jgi:hypothetical protein
MNIDQSIRNGLLQLEQLLKNCNLGSGWLVLSHGKYHAVADLSDLDSRSNKLYWQFTIDQVRTSQICVNTVKKSLCCFDSYVW